MTSRDGVHPVQAAAYAYVGGCFDGWIGAGLRHVVVCPGSRSTPLALLAAERDELNVWTHIDERSAGFFALGLAKALRAPVALVATSGTAVANFLPAVTEAYFGRTPLLLLTADRPREHRDVGMNQTLFQAGVFGAHVKWAVDMPTPEASPELVAYARSAAARAYAYARTGPPGPVHMNFPLREPLIPLPPPTTREAAGEGASARARYDGLPGGPSRREGTEVWTGRPTLSPDEAARWAEELAASRRTLLVAGPDTPPDAREPLLDLAAFLGAPLLADPLSGLRTAGRTTDQVIDAYDVFLRFESVVHAAPPSLVVRFGAWPVSKPLQLYLQHYAGTPHVVVDEGGGWRDPSALATRVVHADPARLVADVLQAAEAAGDGGPKAGAGAPGRRANPWPLVWRRLNDVTREELDEALKRVDGPFEGLVFDALADADLDGVRLYVGNSMPIRDMDAFFPAGEQRIEVFGNRGVSGIDGLVSSALGASAAGGAPTLLVLGDLSFYHDLNGLLAASAHGLDLTVVLIHNDGGGIFSFLPQAEHGRHFERLFGTPTGLDFAPAVEMYGGRFSLAENGADLRRQVSAALAAGGLHVVQYTTEREANARRHRSAMAAVGEAVGRRLSDVFRSAAGGP